MPIIVVGGAYQPCVVTGNLQMLTGGAITQGSVRFELVNFGLGNAVGILGKSVFPWNYYTVVSDVAGSFTVSLWGNDVINPANTLYQVTYYDQTGNSLGVVLYDIVGPSFNMNTATPTVNVVPPVFSSSGYASGAPVSIGNFAISGWGTGATITNIQGVQERCEITITAGVGPTVAPTVVFTYPGAYASAAWNLSQMIGGTGIIADILSSSTTTAATFTYSGLPLATNTFILVFDTKGV